MAPVDGALGFSPASPYARAYTNRPARTMAVDTEGAPVLASHSATTRSTAAVSTGGTSGTAGLVSARTQAHRHSKVAHPVGRRCLMSGLSGRMPCGQVRVDECAHGRESRGDRTAAEGENQASEVSAVQEQHERIAQALRAARSHRPRHVMQALAHLFLVRAYQRTQFAFITGDFCRRIAECAAAAGVGHGDFQLCREQGFDLAARISGISSHGGIPPSPILPFLFAKIFDDQSVLGNEAAVEAHFVGACFRGDLIDTDTVNAVPIKELTGGLKDPVAHPGFGRSARAGVLTASAYACFIDPHAHSPLTTMLPIDNAPQCYPLVTYSDRLVALKF